MKEPRRRYRAPSTRTPAEHRAYSEKAKRLALRRLAHETERIHVAMRCLILLRMAARQRGVLRQKMGISFGGRRLENHSVLDLLKMKPGPLDMLSPSDFASKASRAVAAVRIKRLWVWHSGRLSALKECLFRPRHRPAAGGETRRRRQLVLARAAHKAAVGDLDAALAEIESSLL